MNEGMKINDKVINEAARIGNLYLVKYFLQTYQIPKNILVFSTEIGNIELVKYILEQGININAKNINGETALIWASYNGHTEIVKLLLEQEEIDINAKNWHGYTALRYASEYGHTEIENLIRQKSRCIIA